MSVADSVLSMGGRRVRNEAVVYPRQGKNAEARSKY